MRMPCRKPHPARPSARIRRRTCPAPPMTDPGGSMRRLSLIAAVVLTGACRSTSANPVPMAGDRASLDRLAGEWAGSYENPDAGRGGSIVFTLTAGQDRAHGDVVMVPRGTTQAL